MEAPGTLAAGHIQLLTYFCPRTDHTPQRKVNVCPKVGCFTARLTMAVKVDLSQDAGVWFGRAVLQEHMYFGHKVVRIAQAVQDGKRE